MDEEKTQNASLEDAETPKESLFKSLLPRFPSFNMSFNSSSVLIPVAVIILIILIGGGGTYMVASNVFQKSAVSKTASQISENDIPEFSQIVSPTPIPTFTSTPTPEVIFSNLLTQTPTPTVDPASQWISYTFAPLNMTFKYPPGWYVQVSSSSGPPSFNAQNFSPNSPVPTDTDGVYQIQVSRFPQVGITTVAQLTSQLAVNEANNVYINGVNMGLVTVVNSANKTVNGYQGYERTITYSNSPFAQVYQLFVLDGSGNVVQFTPAYDVYYGQVYFNTLISTISF